MARRGKCPSLPPWWNPDGCLLAMPARSHTFGIFSFADNAIPIPSWFSDPHDTALLDLLPLLDALRFTNDVRSVLSRNLHLHSLWWCVIFIFCVCVLVQFWFVCFWGIVLLHCLILFVHTFFFYDSKHFFFFTKLYREYCTSACMYFVCDHI